MAVDVIMPAMGATQETGRLVRWFKREGDSVAKGEMLMEVETDKSVVEVEAPASGILAQVAAQPDDDILVGHTIALIVEPGEAAARDKQAPEAQEAREEARRRLRDPRHIESERQRKPPAAPLGRKAPARREGKPPATPGPAPATPADAGGPHPTQRADEARPARQPEAGRAFLASPAAKRLAHERGVELAGICGTGPGGAVIARDILSMAPATVEGAPPPGGAGATRGGASNRMVAVGGVPSPPSRMRRIIGERMALSKQTAPHFYLNMDVDMTSVESGRSVLKRRDAGPAPSINDFILKAVARALAESPSMNAAWTDAGIERFSEVNLGVAVAVADGLVVPVIRSADKLTLDELTRRSSELARRAQDRRLDPAEYQGGTFTVSNLGMFGVESFTAIINPPQCGILACGRVAPRVVPFNGGIAVRPMMTVTLSADHRVVDGVIGARFLQRVKQHLEDDGWGSPVRNADRS